jgi:hypothetical protein
VSEVEFLRLTGNHGQFCEKLRLLGHIFVSNEIKKNVLHVGLAWMQLAQEHLEDARAALATTRSRMIFSRSYYAVYNASKAVRYIVNGTVSLKGDDHHNASDLPDDFPNVQKWSEMIPKLYEHRLLADYDNWRSTASEFSLRPDEAVSLASDFVDNSRAYLKARLGANL